MTRRILLHVGSPKCGSTFLQNVLKNNAETLSDAGIHYPAPEKNHPGNAAQLGDMTAAQFDRFFASDPHTVILSHEDLYARPPLGAPLAAWAKDAGVAVQVLAFLRPFNEFVFGDYSQFMKQFFPSYLRSRDPYDGQDFNLFARRRQKTLKPATFLKGWQRQFPDQPLVLAGHRQIQSTLEPLLGADLTLDWRLPAHLGNPSLRTEDCDRLAAALRDPALSARQLREMFQAAHHNTDQPDAGRSLERIVRIEKIFAPQNKALLENFGYDNRVPGLKQKWIAAKAAAAAAENSASPLAGKTV